MKKLLIKIKYWIIFRTFLFFIYFFGELKINTAKPILVIRLKEGDNHLVNAIMQGFKKKEISNDYYFIIFVDEGIDKEIEVEVYNSLLNEKEFYILKEKAECIIKKIISGEDFYYEKI